MVIYYEKYRRKNKALVLGSDRMCTVLKKIRNGTMNVKKK